MTGSMPLIATAISTALLAGLVLAFLRGVKARLAEHLSLPEERLRRLAPAYTLALVLLMLVAGVWIDKWGVREVLISSALCAAVGITLIEAGKSLRSTWPGFVLLALGAGGYAATAAVLPPRAFFADKAAGSLNLAAVFFTLGALATPPLTNWLIDRYGFRRGLLLAALGCLLPGVLALFPEGKEFAGPISVESVQEVVHRPEVWLAALVLFCYRPLQESFGNWPRRYLAEVGYPPKSAAGIFGVFWATFLAARLLGAVAVRPGWEPWWILGASLMTGVVIGNLLGVFRRGSGVTGLMLLAASLAPILPTTLGALLRAYPHAPGAATGVFLSVGLTGALLVPSLIHPAAQDHSVRAAMRLSLVFALLVAAPAIILAVLPHAR